MLHAVFKGIRSWPLDQTVKISDNKCDPRFSMPLKLFETLLSSSITSILLVLL